jgi:Type II site-specific deoxyribonuclease
VEQAFRRIKKPFDVIQAGGRNQPRHDLLVDQQKISLKTETGLSTDPQQITITKLCTTEREPWEARILVERVMEHLARYDIILMFRAVWMEGAIHYQLVDIPVLTLRMIEKIVVEPVGRRSGRQSLAADVMRGEQRIFRVHFDASDGKCSVRNLRIEHCVVLEEWDVRL